MKRFDMRFCVPIIINILKPGDGWDPFDTIDNPTSMKICCFLLISVVFSLTSIVIPALAGTSIVMGGYMHLRVAGELSVVMALSMVASFTFPQALFWYVYPIIVMVSIRYGWVLSVFKCFLGWLQAMAVRAPVFNIIIMSSTATVTHHQPEEEDDDQVMIDSEDGALQAIVVER